VVVVVMMMIKVKMCLSIQFRRMGGAEVNVAPWPLYHQERIHVPIEWKSVWTPEMVWMF
jgi:hypothetical protein